MTSPHQLSKQGARRIAVRAQLLDARRPKDVFEVIRHLGLVQNDPTAAVAPSADLVLWCRLGQDYDPAELRDAIESQALRERFGLIRPPEDIALHRAEMATWPGSGGLKPWQQEIAGWVHDNDACRLEILEVLRADGPLPLRELPDSTVRPWRSSGWTNNRNVEKLVDFMVQRGEVAAAGRDGRERLWDLAERVYPDDPVPDEAEAKRFLDAKRLHALGIARPRAAAAPAEPNDVGEAAPRRRPARREARRAERPQGRLLRRQRGARGRAVAERRPCGRAAGDRGPGGLARPGAGQGRLSHHRTRGLPHSGHPSRTPRTAARNAPRTTRPGHATRRPPS